MRFGCHRQLARLSSRRQAGYSYGGGIPTCRGKDLVVRLGGDEFVVLLFRANRSAADIVSDRIRSHLQKPVEFHSNLLHVEASIGIACFPQDGQTLRDLLHHADQEMYQYKQASRGNSYR
jgi:diguanylate cyclase (GGDEF)-like protein